MERILSQEGIAENFRFMVMETTRQVENALKVLKEPNNKLIESIESRDDYIDNLKSVIDNKCFAAIHRHNTPKRVVDLLRATSITANNLERIADFAVNVVVQTNYLKNHEFIKRYDCDRFFDTVLSALNLVYKAMTTQDVSLAFKICRAESTLDLQYKVQFDRILSELRTGKETENLITSHLILRYLERMGDALLNIGEAVIFAAVGEKFKIRQYEALRETLALSGMAIPISDVEFHSIWGTRSGARIGKVAAASKKKGAAPEHAGVLFKEGNKKKLMQEKENIERWEAVMPGLPPRVLAHQEDSAQASLLIEYLGGLTFQDTVLTCEPEVVQNAFFLIRETVQTIWDHTRAHGPAKAGFVKQIESRLDEVYRLHPQFRFEERKIGPATAPSVEELVAFAKKIEKDLVAPYSVFIHGDFNVNNILYDQGAQQIHYIDLHRSKQSDPLQDVSVFMVSLYRLPIFEPHLRDRLSTVARNMFRFARASAREHGDARFEARLALALARNFITSTRFEFNVKFAKDMFLRGLYLLERLKRHHPRPFEEFTLPDWVMV